MVLGVPEEFLPLRVRAARTPEGRFVGFQDASTGRFIRRADAIPKLTYDIERGFISDSFGNKVGAGALGIPLAGETFDLKVVNLSWKAVTPPPAGTPAGPDQEWVERVVFRTSDGKIITREASYGLGRRYDPQRAGGWWRAKASEALGLPEKSRLSTKELKKAQLHSSIILKTIKPK